MEKCKIKYDLETHLEKEGKKFKLVNQDEEEVEKN